MLMYDCRMQDADDWKVIGALTKHDAPEIEQLLTKVLNAGERRLTLPKLMVEVHALGACRGQWFPCPTCLF